MMGEQTVHCDLCARELQVHESYIVRMEVMADPSMPPLSSEVLAGADFDETLAGLLEEMRGWSAQELQDTVHRRFEFRLCFACQRKFLANPLGKPRTVTVGTN